MLKKDWRQETFLPCSNSYQHFVGKGQKDALNAIFKALKNMGYNIPKSIIIKSILDYNSIEQAINDGLFDNYVENPRELITKDIDEATQMIKNLAYAKENQKWEFKLGCSNTFASMYDSKDSMKGELKHMKKRKHDFLKTYKGNEFGEFSTKTKHGDNILGSYLGEDKRMYVIFKEDVSESLGTYAVGIGYDIDNGTWGQGVYNFKTFEKAKDYIDKKYGIVRTKREVKTTDSKKTRDVNYRGAKNVRLISHGEWADPELEYKGKLFNYWDIEDGMWNDFLERTGRTEESVTHNYEVDREVEEEFDKYVQENVDEYLEDVIFGGYFNDSKKSKAKVKTKDTFRGDEIINDLFDRVSSLSNDGVDDDGAIEQAIDDGLIYYSDIIDLAEHYGVIDYADLVTKFYDDLYADLSNKLEEYKGGKTGDSKSRKKDVRTTLHGSKCDSRNKKHMKSKDGDYEDIIEELMDYAISYVNDNNEDVNDEDYDFSALAEMAVDYGFDENNFIITEPVEVELAEHYDAYDRGDLQSQMIDDLCDRLMKEFQGSY